MPRCLQLSLIRATNHLDDVRLSVTRKAMMFRSSESPKTDRYHTEVALDLAHGRFANSRCCSGDITTLSMSLRSNH